VSVGIALRREGRGKEEGREGEGGLLK